MEGKIGGRTSTKSVSGSMFLARKTRKIVFFPKPVASLGFLFWAELVSALHGAGLVRNYLDELLQRDADEDHDENVEVEDTQASPLVEPPESNEVQFEVGDVAEEKSEGPRDDEETPARRRPYAIRTTTTSCYTTTTTCNWAPCGARPASDLIAGTVAPARHQDDYYDILRDYYDMQRGYYSMLHD
eukprot:jgi/Phyca11/14287/fgenesh1_pg.PHYCAscaffold_7_\